MRGTGSLHHRHALKKQNNRMKVGRKGKDSLQIKHVLRKQESREIHVMKITEKEQNVKLDVELMFLLQKRRERDREGTANKRRI